MNLPNILQYVVFLAIVIACVKPVGSYLFRVFNNEKTPLDPVLLPIERFVYRVAGVDPQSEMNWTQYTLAFVLFSGLGTALLFLILVAQRWLPWFDPDHFTTPMTIDLALNTAISFSTTTTWQVYGGETTMSYFSQMVGLTSQNFLAGGAGLAVGIAFIHGLVREKTKKLGNFWVDLTRAILWVLLPLSILGTLVLVWQGVPLNLNLYASVTTVEGMTQTIAQGPVAALESIKNLGTNGGGFFNVNAAHPYENPTSLTNLVEMLMIVILPAALTYTFGRMVGSPRQGVADLLGHDFVVRRGTYCLRIGRAGRKSPRQRARRGHAGIRSSNGRQYGREGGSVWHSRLGVGGDSNIRWRNRIVQFDARQLYPARRNGAAREYAAWRNHLWRAGDGHLQHGDVGPSERLHRWVDGGPHADISSQAGHATRN